MLSKITAFFSATAIFFMSLFGISGYGLKYDLYNNLRYGDAERNVFDIAFPKKAKGDVDLILYIHGGGWIAGDKNSYIKDLGRRAKSGYVAAAMNYRYTCDDVNCFDILDDITACLEAIKAKGIEKGININKVLLTGHSAGAHLSLFYAYTKADEAPVKPAAVVEMSGPTDIATKEAADFYIFKNETPTGELFNTIFSDLCGKDFTAKNYYDEDSQKLLKSVSPLYFVNESCVPTVICHGKKDTIVPYSNAVDLDRALTEKGVEHTLITFPNSDHGLESDPDCSEEMNRVTDEYLSRYLTAYSK